MNPLILGPAVTAGIAALLAFLIALTDRFMNDYGEVVLDINAGKKRLDVKGGSPLLGTLAGQEIFLPSACGGRGSCGACKVKVLSDVGPHLPTELPYLSPGELAQNIRLGCQVKVRKSLDLELPAYLFNIRKYATTVLAIRDLTYDIKELRVGLPGGEGASASMGFEPGQYAQIVIPPHGEQKTEVQRAYSMSSEPAEAGVAEFLVRLVPGGIATTWIHSSLKVGDRLDIVGPFGDFRIHDTPAAMICVAGGSGMAPFKSMLNHMAHTGAFPAKEIWYFFGARSMRDMFYLEEMAALEGILPRFHFVPALSEPKPEDAWTGPTGLITKVLDEWLKTRIGPELPKEGYLCGSPGMIDACKKVMGENGIAEDRIYYDKFA